MAASLQEALDASGYLGTWETNLGSQVVELTGALPRLLAIDEARGAAGVPVSTFLQGVHPEDREHIAHLVHEAHSTAGRFEAEFRTCDQDGSVHWIAARGRVETDSAGRGLRCIGLMVDLTGTHPDHLTADDHVMRTVNSMVDALIALRPLAGDLGSSVLPILIDNMLLQLGKIIASKMDLDQFENVH